MFHAAGEPGPTFAQHGQASTAVLAALVVVGGGGQQVVGEVAQAPLSLVVEMLGARAEALGLEADIVARQQPCRAVEGGVFHSLGGTGCGELLEAHAGMAQVLAWPARWQLAPGLATEPLLELVEQRPVGLAKVLAGIGQGLLEEAFILGRAPAGIEVGAIHRVMRNQRLQCAANRAKGQVAGHQVVTGDLQQRLGDGFAIAGEAGIEHQMTRQAHLLGERGALADRRPQFGQRRFTGRVVLQQRDLVHELVAGGAVGQPVAVQVFVGAEDLST